MKKNEKKQDLQVKEPAPVMEDRTFQAIRLLDISVNPLNPRKNFSGPKYDELLASVKKKGVLIPILVRPLPSGSPTPYEIIAGERRYRVSCDLAKNNGGMQDSIPALIQEMSDDDAFDVMTIENLQRADLTPLEEARAFKIYLDKKGMEALPDLAERVGINPCYIRRRTSVLGLPEEILEAWEEGHLHYGHLDQFIRISDTKQLEELFSNTISYGWAVKYIKDRIDGQSPKISKALFDKKTWGCANCLKNTDVQRNLFGDDIGEKSLCLDPKCFKEHQGVWIYENWAKFKSSRSLKTNGARFREDVNYDRYEVIYNKIKEKCLGCEFFQSLVNVDGAVSVKETCIGDKSCFNELYRGKTTTTKQKQNPDEPRVSWHGEYFREEFYKDRLPELVQAIPSDGENVLRLLLLCLLETHSGAAYLFGKKYPNGKNIDMWDISSGTRSWPIIEGMDIVQLRSILHELALSIVMDHGTTRPQTRRKIAVYLGSDLQSEWKMTQEYLDKKTTKEIHAIAEQFGLWKDEKAKAYLYETLGVKRDRFDLCKKGDLVKIILESGMDLSGMVPKEILGDQANVRYPASMREEMGDDDE
jgi:ParB/RepB/Spo0J family partition protein